MTTEQEVSNILNFQTYMQKTLHSNILTENKKDGLWISTCEEHVVMDEPAFSDTSLAITLHSGVTTAKALFAWF